MTAAVHRLVLLLLLALGGGRLAAQTTVLTWSENPVSNSFNLASSWVSAVFPVPPPGSTTLVQFNGSGIIQPTLSSSASVLGISFAPGAGAYTLSLASGALPTGVNLTVGASGIVSQSASRQTISVPLLFSAPTVTPINAVGTGQILVSGPVSLSGGGIAFGGAGAGGSVSGTISGFAPKVAFTGGLWTLSGANTYDALTEIAGGELRLASGLALPAGKAVTLNPAAGASAVLNVNGQTTAAIGQLTFSGASGSSSSLVLGSTGTLNLGGNVTYDASAGPGGASISGGTLALGSASRTFVVGSSPATSTGLSIDARISGLGGIIKQGGGTMVISNPGNLFLGPVVVNAGSLVAGAPAAIPAGTAVTVDGTTGSAGLYLSGTSQTVGTLTLGAAGRGMVGVNAVEPGFGGVLAIGGTLTVNASGLDGGARIGSAGFVSVVDAQPTNGQLVFNGPGTINVLRNNPAAVSVIDLHVSTSLAGSSAVQKNGPGSLLLEGSGSLLTGALNVNQGTVLFGGTFAPAGGTSAGGGVVVASGAVIGAGARTRFSSGENVLGKSVTLNSGAQIGSVELDQGFRLNLSGPVVVRPSSPAGPVPAATVSLGGYAGTVVSGTLFAETSGTAVEFVSATPGQLGFLALTGTVDPGVGAITANRSALILSTVPASTTLLGATNGGYIGIAPPTSTSLPPAAQAVIDRVGSKASFSGTFGLDSLRGSSVLQTYADDLDFTGFGAGLTVGSATGAVLTGRITPAGSTYAFGNGGGVLVLRTALTDAGPGQARNVTVNSSAQLHGNALKLLVQAKNAFSGSLSVANSAVVVDVAGGLPAAAGVNLGTGGYLGFTENGGFGLPGGFSSLLSPSRLTVADPGAVIGLDSQAFIGDVLSNPNGSSIASRWVRERVDLGGLLNPVFLGTITNVTLGGSLVGPLSNGQRVLGLAGVDGGVISVRSLLTDANARQVTIGVTSSSALNSGGSVTLQRANTYSGGTILGFGTAVAGVGSRYSGTALVSGAFGTGPISVPSGVFGATLAAAQGTSAAVLVGNPIRLAERLSLGQQYFPGVGVGNGSVSVGGAATALALSGLISDVGTSPAGLDIYGSTLLSGPSTFAGGVNLYGGRLTLGSDSVGTGTAVSSGPLGTGTLTLSDVGGNFGRSIEIFSDGARTVGNQVSIQLGLNPYVNIGGTGPLTLSGGVTLGSLFKPSVGSFPVYLAGSVGGPGGLEPLGLFPVVLTGVNSYQGGTSASSGSVVFGSAAAIPSVGVLTSMFRGYVGLAGTAGATAGLNIKATFLDRFDKIQTTGSIGFDTLDAAGKLVTSPVAAATFSGDVNLAGFNSAVRIGSSSVARLTGLVTPQNSNYQFGGGAGWLEVGSSISNPVGGVAALSVDSSAGPLTVRLTGTNTFTGGGTVYASGLIFGGTGGSLPAAGTFAVGGGGYIGAESSLVHSGAQMSSFLQRIAAGPGGLVVGFDTAPGGAPVTVTGAIPLNQIQLGALPTTGDPNIFIGTSTEVALRGNIVLPPGQSTYRFAGYKGGSLTVGVPISSGAIQVGDAYSQGAFGSIMDPGLLSTVTLAAANSHAGGTRLESGRLLLGDSSALGSGTFTVFSQDAYGRAPQLGSTLSGLTVANPVDLSQWTGLNLTGVNSFSLTGVISGVGGIQKTGSASVTLAGTNSFTGDVEVRQGTLIFAGGSSAGAGTLRMPGPDAPVAVFQSGGSLAGVQGDAALARIEVADGRTLKVAQTAAQASYAGSFGIAGAPANPAGITLAFSGSPVGAQLQLSGSSNYLGSTTIGPGMTVFAGAGSVFGQSSVRIDAGGALVIEGGVNVANPLVLAGGALAGAGRLTVGSSLAVGNGSFLAPGFDLIGTLSLAPAAGYAGTLVELLGGGGLRLKMGDATDTSGGWDRVSVAGPVALPTTNPFMVKLAPVGDVSLGAAIGNFDPLQSYAWPFLSATSLVGSFSPAMFAVDATAFSSLAPDFKFSVGLDPLGSSLVLNYNPAAVPEPSTWVMLLSGAAAGAFWLRRRRRA